MKIEERRYLWLLLSYCFTGLRWFFLIHSRDLSWSCLNRSQQDSVKGIGASIEGGGHNLPIVIDCRGGVETVIDRCTPDETIQVLHQAVAVHEGHQPGFSGWGWEITVTHHLIGSVDTQGKAEIAVQGSATKRAEIEHPFAIIKECMDAVVEFIDRRVADDVIFALMEVP